MLTKYEASKILIKDRLHIMNLFFLSVSTSATGRQGNTNLPKGQSAPTDSSISRTDWGTKARQTDLQKYMYISYIHICMYIYSAYSE